MKLPRTAALALAVALIAPSAHAVCLGSGVPAVESLMQEVARHPALALPKIDAALADTAHTDRRMRAWLTAARSVARGALGKGDRELPIAVERAAASLADTEPALLLMKVAEVLVSGATADALEDVDRLRPLLAAHPPRAQSTLCATAILAHHLARNDHPVEAFALAAQAYRGSSDGRTPWARAEAASVLAQIVRFQWDRDYAIALHTEALTYFESAALQDLLANELAMRAWSRMGDDAPESLKAAEVDLMAASKAAREADDRFAVASANHGLCELRTDAARLDEARSACEAGFDVFRGSGDPGEHGMTVSHARFLLHMGNPAAALELLNQLFASGTAADSDPYTRMAFHVRGRAHAALGEHRRAAEDLETAIRLDKLLGRQSQTTNAAITRARFQTEELANSLIRKTQEHEDSLHRGRLIVAFGTALAALLAALVIVMARHRLAYRRLAFTDALTGLPNRHYTEVRVNAMLSHARARRRPLTLAILDLDHFKSCNDNFGHDAGDEALRTFAKIASERIRPGDVLGRWGGEEFLLAMADTDQTQTQVVLDRIRDAAARAQLQQAPAYTLKFSAGAISVLDYGDDPLASLLSRADTALYAAKDGGRNQTCLAAVDLQVTPAAREEAVVA